ncbi:uncharacterized protein PAC_19752 [Phialocephala subalpina]|uniref:Uncharacterized protein n=1 Tax=Phialocephala subalpina TaxID=576137 RepID=A0A1L7XXP8_9HELO|nr:uncharacterized protein PAC_19752 [Phialocephala subalpina]
MADIPSSPFALSGVQSQKLRIYCANETWASSDLDSYARLLHDGNLDTVRKDFVFGQGGPVASRQRLANLQYGPTKIPIFNLLLQFTVLFPQKRAQYIQVIEFLAKAKVPVDSTDLSGTTALSHSISTKPYFDTEIADILITAGGDINHQNRYGCLAGHEIVMARDYSEDGKKKTVDAMKYYVEHGGKVDIPDNDGVTVTRIGNTIKLVIPGLALYFP